MFDTIRVAARDRQRLSEIGGFMSRYGIGVLAARLGLADRGGDAPPDLPRRTREAIEALGPTFIKLGQILATRGDLLGPEWIEELSALHADAPTLPFETLRPQVEAALGDAPEALFATFDPQPLAAASIAQVHRATLEDGREVVLKIRRPGISETIAADLRLIAELAAIAERASAEARRFTPVAMARQLATAMLEELDLASEGRHADALRADFAGDDRVVVPVIHWRYTSETLLVMDYIDGIRPVDGDTLRAAGIDPVVIAESGADIVLDMVLLNGRFHADPHPGNLLCQPGNRIALLDMGMTGQISHRRRQEFIGFVRALGSGDAAALADTLAVWTGSGPGGGQKLTPAAEGLIARHGGGQRIVLAALVTDMLRVMREERLVLPPDLLIVFKALMTLDGVLGRIAPDNDLSGAMARATARVTLDRVSPATWTAQLAPIAWELSRLGDDAPALIRAAVARLQAPPVIGPGEQAIVSALRRLSASVLVAAVIVAAAVVLT